MSQLQNVWFGIYFVNFKFFDHELCSKVLTEAYCYCCWRGIKFKKCYKWNRKCANKTCSMTIKKCFNEKKNAREQNLFPNRSKKSYISNQICSQWKLLQIEQKFMHAIVSSDLLWSCMAFLWSFMVFFTFHGKIST